MTTSFINPSNQDYLWLKINDINLISNPIKFKTGSACQSEIRNALLDLTNFEDLLRRANINQNQIDIDTCTENINSNKLIIKNSIPGFYTLENKILANWVFSLRLVSRDVSRLPIPNSPQSENPDLYGINVSLCKNQLVNNYKDNHLETLLNNKYSFFSTGSQILHTKTIYIKELQQLSDQNWNFQFRWSPDEEIQITSNDKLSIKIWRNDEYKYQNFRDSFSFKTQINWI